MASRYRTVRALALRLLQGEIIEQVDRRGQTLRGTLTQLLLIQPDTGEVDPVIDGDAFDVAAGLESMPHLT